MFTDTFGNEIKRAGVKTILKSLDELTNLTGESGDNYSFVGTDANVSLTRLCENGEDLYSLAQEGQENVQVDAKDRELIAELFVLAYKTAVDRIAEEARIEAERIKDLQRQEQELCQQLKELIATSPQPELSLVPLQLSFEKPSSMSASPDVDKSTETDPNARTTSVPDSQPAKDTLSWALPPIWESPEPSHSKTGPDFSNCSLTFLNTPPAEPLSSKPLSDLPAISLFKN